MEFDLLRVFAEHPNQVLSNEQLLVLVLPAAAALALGVGLARSWPSLLPGTLTPVPRGSTPTAATADAADDRQRR